MAARLTPVLEGRRWLRVGRGGAPVEVAQLAWPAAPAMPGLGGKAILTLTSDLLVRDECLRWRSALDEAALNEVVGGGVKLGESLQDSVMVHGFNGTARLWRMPAAAVRRGSVFEISGAGVAKLAERAAKSEWLGERTHEGFGRFRLDVALPGVTSEAVSGALSLVPDVAEEAIVKKTKEWFDAHKSLAKPGGGSDRKPSLSQWLDLVSDLERGDKNALSSRLSPTTAGAKSWKQKDAKAILDKLNDRSIQPKQCALHARLFVRWLRADLRARTRGA